MTFVIVDCVYMTESCCLNLFSIFNKQNTYMLSECELIDTENISLLSHNRVREIAYGFGGPSEKKCQSSLIFYCKIPILCQSLAKSAQILLVMSDRTDTFRELCHNMKFIGE